MQYLRKIRAYELIALASGFALMAYELAGARILSPVVGSSMYVWTSIIGVIVAALSIGYALGGVVADKRVKPQDVTWLLLASALTVVLTVYMSKSVLDAVTTAFSDARLQGLVASLALFMPTSFLLGMISPYLARLRTESVATTGTSIASLSAMNAIGGILGTFCTGFIFFGYFGSNQSMLLVSMLLVCASWLLAPRFNVVKRAGITAAVIVLGILMVPLTAQQDVVASIDTLSSRYIIADRSLPRDGIHRPVRLLLTGADSAQSGVYMDGSDELVFEYTRKMTELVNRAPHKGRILILGGGAFTMPQYLAEKYPQSQIDVVEIDPQLVDISRQYFRYKEPANVRVISQDARAFLNSNGQRYDVVLVDVYSELFIPFTLSTKEYGKQLKRAVADDGFVAVNIIGADAAGCRDLLRGIHGSYKRYFKEDAAYPIRDAKLSKLQNIISVYANQSQTWLPPEDRIRLKTETTDTFTDNFAPVERLRQQCASAV